MSGFLSRVAKKGMGTPSAVMAAPNWQPYFPPSESGVEAASLDGRGDVIFRAAASPAAFPGAARGTGLDAESHANTLETVQSPPMPRTTAVKSHQLATELRSEAAKSSHSLAGQVPAAVPSAPSPVSVPSPKAHGLSAGIPDEIRDATPTTVEVVQPLEAYPDPPEWEPKQPNRVREIAPPVTELHDEIPKIIGVTRAAAAHPSTSLETRNLQHSEFIEEEIGSQTLDEHRETGEGNKVVARPQPIPEPPRNGKEETVTQVRIGRIEVRVDAAAPAPGPPLARARGPQGFAGYESVRRYLTRNLM